MFSKSKEKILLIDKDQSFSGALSASLSAMGMENSIVSDQFDAMDMMVDDHYGIVIVDSDKNVSVISEISQKFPSIVVLATVKKDDIGVSVQALKAGAIDLVPEKMEPGQLETIMRRAIDRRLLIHEGIRLKKRIKLLCLLAGICFLAGFLIFYL